MIKWETINNKTERLKVPGGWLVKVEEIEFENGCNCDDGIKHRTIAPLFFFNDPFHKWDIKDKNLTV